MFTNLIGYIKPLLRKKSPAATDIAKSRVVNDDPPHQQYQEHDFDHLVDPPPDHQDSSNNTAPRAPADKMELSLKAIRHLIKESGADQTDQDQALQIVDQLEAAGHKTLPFMTDESVIDQIQHYNET